jgi:hypothetical protein
MKTYKLINKGKKISKKNKKRLLRSKHKIMMKILIILKKELKKLSKKRI